jgi:ComF family protein
VLDRARACLAELLSPSRCPSCSGPRRAGEPLLCARCAAGLRAAPELGGTPIALLYEGTAERLIVRWKFERRSDALAVLLEPLLERLAELPAGALVPVPRHARRVRSQGSDPVYRLALALARRSGRSLAAGVLHRARPAPPQTGLSPRERRENAAGSFGARPGALRGQAVVLLDDVTTTGATLREAARVLREVAQAAAVQPLALAGTPRECDRALPPAASAAL